MSTKKELQNVVSGAIAIAKKALADNYCNVQGKDDPKVVVPIAEVLIKHALRDQDENGVWEALLEEEEEEITQSSESAQVLERDEDGKPRIPRIILKSMANKSVHVPTQKDYWDLMKIYECGIWEWCLGNSPTSNNTWSSFGEETCVDAEDRFVSRDRALSKANGLKVITLQEFYDAQGITPEILKKVKDYFDGLGR
jgi:hypothetical protein